MLDGLDTTLQAVIKHKNAPQAIRDADVSFQSPDRHWSVNSPTINCFLYQIQENRGLREARARYDKEKHQLSPAPLRLDCFYLITTWSALMGDNKIREEHNLLGGVLSWLHGFAEITKEMVNNDFVNLQDSPIRTLVAPAEKLESIAWHSLGTPPRPAFSYQMTVTLPPSRPPFPVAPLVTEKQFLVYKEVYDANKKAQLNELIQRIPEMSSDEIAEHFEVIIQKKE